VLRSARWWLAGLLVLTALAFANALSTPFFYDEILQIRDNGYLRSTHGLVQMLTHARVSSSPVWSHFRPLFVLSFFVDWQLHGPNPFGYRLLNLVVHLANGALIFTLARRLLRGRLDEAQASLAALLAAMLFLLHPVQAVVVELTVKRNTSLCTLCSLGALIFFLQWLERARRLDWAASFACAVLAVTAKEDAIALPLQLALVGLFVGAARPIRRALPFFVPPLALALVMRPERQVFGASSIAYLLAQPAAALRYLTMLVNPSAIGVAYDVEATLSPFPWARLLALVAGIAALLFLCVRARKWPLPAFAAAWLAVTIAPSSSLFPLGLAADHVRLYFALFGVQLGAGVLLARMTSAIERRVSRLQIARLIALAPSLLLTLLLARATLAENALWSVPRDLYRHTVENNPGSAIAERLYCESLGAARDPDAVKVCETAVALAPADPWARYALIAAWEHTADHARAGDELARALAALPDSWVIRLAEGHHAWVIGDRATARRAYLQVLAVDPENDSARLRLADVFLDDGDRARAEALFLSFAGVPPGNPGDQTLYVALRRRFATSAR
jgi:tetratricopeptide (TPR) repeat protein